MTATAKTGRGCAWLLEPQVTAVPVTPESLGEEHRLIARTAREFVEKDVAPSVDALERKDWDQVRRLVHTAGELGLLGADVPEVYGGVGLNKLASIIVAENVASPASFASTFGGQTNLAILPILCFGTAEQKRRYVTRLVAGEIVGAYALSESGAGSDALGAKARATRNADGSFLLNGEKMWITNGGFADVFIVFAKLDGEQFSAFIVERDYPGVSTGKEEHKMGLHGSSTTPLILQDARVPADGLLGEIGRGHKVAFNTLNYGRLKLGAMCVGGSKLAIAEAARYAAQRKQFGQPIASFGAIKYKLGEMLARAYAVESMVYRTTGLIDERLPETRDDGGAVLDALEEFSVEASIVKVAASEMIDYVLDENIQIHGGNGYVHDYPAEGRYRDARVNRIFEGTNEINRLLIPGMLARRTMKGEFGLLDTAGKVPSQPAAAGEPTSFARQHDTVAALKQIGIRVLVTAMQTFESKLSDEQEVLMKAADILIDAYGAESALLRAERSSTQSSPTAALHRDAAIVAVETAAVRVDAAAREALTAMVDADRLPALLDDSRRLLSAVPIDTVAPRRRLADAQVARATYLFSN